MTAKLDNGKVTCFLISGKINSGKSTAATILELQLSSINLQTEVALLSTPLKLAAKMFFGWDGNKDSLTYKGRNGRHLLQNLGDAGREYNKDLWAEILDSTFRTDNIFPSSCLVIPDWRHFDEANYFIKSPLYETVLIRVYNDKDACLPAELAAHNTEKELPEAGDVTQTLYEFILLNKDGDRGLNLQQDILNMLDVLLG